MVGRDEWLADIAVTLTEVAQGKGGCVVVEGLAGVGKSRLLAAAAEQAVAKGMVVAEARHTELDRIAPLGALLRALRATVPQVLDADAVEALSDLRGSRFYQLDRLGELIEEFAGRQSLLVLLDDAQWADELTALALRTLVPALRSSGVLWLIARRPQPAGSHAGEAVDWLVSEGARRLTLGPLPPAEVRRLCSLVLDAEPDPEVLLLAERGGGNPFLVEQLLITMVEDGRIAVRDGKATVIEGELPSTFVSAVDHRLRDLTPSARRLLDVASVLGRSFSLHEAAGLAGIPTARMLTAVDETTRAGILVNSGAELAFAHDLLREAVYQSLSGAVRRALHREATTVLRYEGRPVVEVVEHMIRSARKGDRPAIDTMREAAADIALRTPATAAELLVNALDLMDPADADRPALLAEVVRLLAAAGRLVQARELADSALRQGLDVESEAAILVGLAEALKHAGEDSAVVESTTAALARTGVPAAARAQLLAVRSHALLYVDDLAGADEAGAEAVRVGTEADEPAAVVFGAVARSVVARSSGYLDRSVELARDATELAETSGGEARWRHPALWLGRALVCADRLQEAEAIYERGRREAERAGTVWSQPLWHFYRAELLLASGRLDDAKAEAEAGLLVTERTSARATAVGLYAILAEVALHRDELPEAVEHVERAKALLAAGVGAMPEDLDWAVALVHHTRGDPDAAIEVLRGDYEALPGRFVLFVHHPTAAPWMVRLAQESGHHDWAREAVRAMDLLARNNPAVASLVGAAAQAEGLLRDDPALLRSAVEVQRSGPRPLGLASAMEDLAAAEHAAGRRPSAVSLLDEALDVYARCGAVRDHARVLKALRSLGVRRRTQAAPTPARTGWASLTEAEMRVARLVAQGLSNRAAAERLFLSPHTVDTHLRHAFAKLGVSSRVELTRRVMEHERQ
ncbi:AAA family ATPase [Saccharothrix sp. NEAU-S10]|nr:AAA family ATPase [Saccharothrix luteola]